MARALHQTEPRRSGRVLLADVYGYRDKDSAAVLQMSVPSFKLLLHSARRRLRWIEQIETASADSRHLVFGAASNDLENTARVVCHLKRTQLSALQEKLLHGLEPRR